LVGVTAFKILGRFVSRFTIFLDRSGGFMEVTVYIRGCDDSTSVQMTVPPVGYAALQELSRKSKEASKYQCQPDVTVYSGHLTDEEIWDLTHDQDF